jgi:hypothetical protein
MKNLRKYFGIVIILLTTVTSFGQTPENHPKHENHYKVIPPIETSDYKIEIINAHTQTQFAIIKVRISNKTGNYIVYEPSETEFVFEHGTFKPYKKRIIIAPWQYTTRTIKVSGDSRFHVEKYTLNIKGLYVLPAKGKTYVAPEFSLPNTTNYFDIEDVYNCKVSGRIIKETQVTEVPFRCTYVGHGVGLIDPSKLVLRLEDGREFAVMKTGNFFTSISTAFGDANIVFPGEEEKVLAVFRIPSKITDMQFANMEIDFKDAFMDAQLTELYSPTIEFELDLGKTAGKNQ